MGLADSMAWEAEFGITPEQEKAGKLLQFSTKKYRGSEVGCIVLQALYDFKAKQENRESKRYASNDVENLDKEIEEFFYKWIDIEQVLSFKTLGKEEGISKKYTKEEVAIFLSNILEDRISSFANKDEFLDKWIKENVK